TKQVTAYQRGKRDRCDRRPEKTLERDSIRGSACDPGSWIAGFNLDRERGRDTVLLERDCSGEEKRNGLLLDLVLAEVVAEGALARLALGPLHVLVQARRRQAAPGRGDRGVADRDGGGSDHRARREHYGALDRVLELAHVARPVVLEQPVARARLE